MKHILWCLLLLSQCTLAQTSNNTTDLSGVDISGNPYLFKDWCNGTVRFSSGRVMNQFKLKFDCLKNQLLLQFEGSAFAAESKIEEFVIYPKAKTKDSLVFRKGFPATDKGTDQTYYQVLFSDKVQLLRLFFRNVIEEHKLVSTGGASDRHMEEAEQYYLLQNNSLTVLPANKSDLAGKFPQLAEFITSQSLKMRDPEDFLTVIKKYNELIP